MKVLFIARYRDATMNRKVELLAHQPDLTIWHICPQRWQDEFVQVEQTGTTGESFRRIAVPMIGRAGDPHRALYRTLSFRMNRVRPDIIHAEEEPDSLVALQIALARRVAAPGSKLLLYTWQTMNRPKRWYVHWVLQMTLRVSDAILCAAREAVDVLRQEGYTKHVRVLPSIGVDTGTLVPCQRPVRDRQVFAVGYVGRPVPEKGIDLLISALAQLKQSGGPGEKSVRTPELRTVGGESDRYRLETQVKRCGLTEHVQFVAPMRPAQVAQYLCQLDVLVLPSRSTPVWKEQFGRVLVEAMACKVPVIGSDSGAIPEVIADAGLVFPEGNVVALATSLRRLVESPDLCDDLAERGYARVMHLCTPEHIARQTVDFYRQIITYQ